MTKNKARCEEVKGDEREAGVGARQMKKCISDIQGVTGGTDQTSGGCSLC